MSALVDTSVLLGFTSVGDKIPHTRWVVSIVSIGELAAGVLLASDPDSRAARQRHMIALLSDVRALPADRHVAQRYAELRAATGRQPSNDLWIAATALAHDLTLVTADERMAALPLVRSAFVG